MVQKERREENIFEGRNALEREFRRNNIRVPEEELEDFLKMDMHRHSCDTLDDFFAAIGYGGVQLSKVMQRLKSEYNKKYGEKAQPDTSDLENKIKTSKIPPVLSLTASTTALSSLHSAVIRFQVTK